MKISISIILCIFFFFSCSSKKNNEETAYKDFPQEKELKAETIVLDTAIFKFPFRVQIEGDRAVVMDLHNADYYVHLFEYPSFRYLTSVAKRGESPTDMLSVDKILYLNRRVWTLDSNKRELTGFLLSSSNDSLLRDEVVTLGEDVLRPLDFTIYDDTTFITTDYTGENRFCWVNHKGKLLRKTGTIPTINEEALKSAKPALAQAWRTFIDYNPKNGVLAAVTQLGEVLEIYNLKDNTRVTLVGENGEPKFKIAEGYGVPTGILGFCDVKVTDNAIYAVFDGTTFKELIQSQGKAPDGGKYIYVFSLKGEPLCKYTLDRHLNGIWVDETTKTIIGTDVNNDQPIVRFRF